MKVLGIVCSPRRGGNTEVLIDEALASAKEQGAEVELVSIARMNIAPCDGCESCATSGKCHIDDDMQQIYSKLLDADGIIFGTPVYFWDVSAQAKALIDRTFVFRKERQLRNKVAGVVVVARRTGASYAFGSFLNFFALHRMITAGGGRDYIGKEQVALEGRGGGSAAYADKRGEVRQDERGMEDTRALGRNVVRTIQWCKENESRPDQV